MNHLKDLYCSEEEDDEQLDEGLSAGLPSEILDKYCISPNVEKYEYALGSDMRGANFAIGKWSSFVFIETRPSRRQQSLLDAILHKASARLGHTSTMLAPVFNPLHVSELGSPLPLHVSLTANLDFGSARELDTFAKMLQIEVLQNFPAGPLDITFAPRLRVYDNIEHSSLFLALEVAAHVKSRSISRLCTLITESLDFCRSHEPSQRDAARSSAWSFENAHMSIARCDNSAITRKYAHQCHLSPAFSAAALRSYRQELANLNQLLESMPLESELLDELKFQCSGIKLTKERANVWAPFASLG
ncbi:LAQU0S28e00584g1_1 [Lachancea quebecensis]|uniref:LAQU0S28e00584g1_1 n=1 Tax=Lachancea quebecensis TaxID=1654605 RepID=A0A0P1KY62_9SACH|nr:LAQU0S28e00584g1_1 [Lachancea quebecensis]